MNGRDPQWELEYLEKRINTFHLNQRLGIEEHREAWIIGQGINLVHIENWYSIHSVIRNSLRLLNLHKRGQRNAADIKVLQQDIHIKCLPSGFAEFTILQLSDLHIDINPQLAEVHCKAVQNLDYDICVMTGDYRAKTWGSHQPAIDGINQLRQELHGDLYAILGNHDSIRMLPHLETMDIKVLVNQSIALTRNNDTIYLAGIDDPHYYRSDNMELACDAIPQDAVSILLSHSPEIYKQAAYAEFDLMLCGHMHGGQICLPGRIPLMVNANCPRRFIKGLWQFGAMQGYTSVGSGTSVVDVRFNCPPEITLLRLLPADDLAPTGENDAGSQ
jgi:predicted MPP superfamily phosphohydrolase